MTKAPELKPCPWCGMTNITKADDGESEWLICANCEATGPYSPDAYAANMSIEQAWNTRAASPAHQMREALEEIAKQKKTDELETEYDVEVADFETGYDMCIDRARAALKAAESSEPVIPTQAVFEQMKSALKICIEHGSVYGHKAAVAALKAAEGE